MHPSKVCRIAEKQKCFILLLLITFCTCKKLLIAESNVHSAHRDEKKWGNEIFFPWFAFKVPRYMYF